MLLNLLVNANKFTRGGEIKVFCEINHLRNLITIQVKDNGIGIEEKDKQKVFTPFEYLEHG